MATDHASAAAAVIAGYKQTTLDRGAAYLPAGERFTVQLSKPIAGYIGGSGGEIRAHGVGSALATAETQAAAALNVQRKHRYGFGAANSGSGSYGGAMTDDRD